jgi:L-lysine exporter family protein LysE/ArgO
MIALLPGFLLGLSLIVAIGAQNAFVIRQGLTKQHVLLVVSICALADALLIALGIAGLGAVISSMPAVLEVIRWFGVVYLSWFTVKSFRAAFANQTMDAAGGNSVSRSKIVATVLGFTFLNPHVYLDTVIFIGSIGNQFQENRWFFGAGAMLASLVWFFAIGFGARSLSRFMSRPVFWKILDLTIAVIMATLAILLAFFKF